MAIELTAEQQAKMDKFKEAVTGAAGRAPEQVAAGDGIERDGSKIDWTQYDLDRSYFHFYPRATFEELEQGWKWTVPYTEFHNESVVINKGKVAQFLEAMINGPDGWILVALVNNGSGLCNIVLRRNTKLVLPDPVKIDDGAPVVGPTTEEVAVLDDAAAKWEKGE